jgi:UDP-N-acetylglucosamine 2-epimerase
VVAASRCSTLRARHSGHRARRLSGRRSASTWWLEGENLVTSAKSTGLGLSSWRRCSTTSQPDAVVTIADRYETLATAVAASYMNIPVVHVQGGEVTGSIDEKVRHAVTKLSNLHLVSTPGARARDPRWARAVERRLTGCPSIDIAAEVAASPRSTSIRS